MIVVPAFTEGKYGNPKTILGSVVSKKPPRTPHVRRRVYEPGGMQPEHGSHEYPPQEKRPATDRKQCNSKYSERHPVPLGDPNMKLVFSQVGDIGQQLGNAVVHGLPRHDPTHMRPQAAILRRVRIT